MKEWTISQIKNQIDECVVDEMIAFDMCVERDVDEQQITCIRKKRIFKPEDKKVILMYSKMYPQGDKENTGSIS